MPDQPRPSRRSALSVQLLTQFGLDHGLALEDCLHGSGLDLAVLADPAREIDAACELQVLRNLAQRLPAGSGLQAGLRYHLNAYGIWGFALLSSPTFRSAALLGLRYLGLTYVFTRLELQEDGAEAHLLLDDSDVPEDVRAKITAQIPIGRLGEPDEIAYAVSFFVDDKARWITGANLAINGGQYMGW